jgi:asparagine synthetase B (glutamine-hydrolysing)
MNLNTLFLARDRFGIKPLYIINEAGRIAFASEMKSFKALPNFKFELDEPSDLSIASISMWLRTNIGQLSNLLNNNILLLLIKKLCILELC